MNYAVGWTHILLLVVIFTQSLVSSARNLPSKRQFPFLLGDATSAQPSTTFGPTDILPTLSSDGHTSRLRTSPRSSSLSQPTFLPLHSSTTTSANSASSQSSTESLVSLAVSPTSTYSVDSPSASKSASTWQIIGIAVTCVTVVGVIILSAAFFDQWSRFLSDVVCGKKAEGLGDEELLPPTKNWAYEIREGRMSNLRYPTQIFSPPLDAPEPIKRPVRSSFFKRFSSQPCTRQFHRFSTKHGGLSARDLNSAGIHPSINVGDIYPVAGASSPSVAHSGLGLFGGMAR